MDLPSAEGLIAALRDLGVLAYPACLAIMIVSAIVPIPAEFPAMLNGAVLGLWGGSGITWLGAMIGAVVSYESASWLHARFGPRLFSATAHERFLAHGQRTTSTELLLLRLTPVVAFHLLNYVAGLARVPRSRFLLTTGVGILPGAFAFTAGGMAVAHWMSNPWVKWGALALVIAVLAARWYRGRHSAMPLQP